MEHYLSVKKIARTAVDELGRVISQAKIWYLRARPLHFIAKPAKVQMVRDWSNPACRLDGISD